MFICKFSCNYKTLQIFLFVSLNHTEDQSPKRITKQIMKKREFTHAFAFKRDTFCSSDINQNDIIN